MSLFKRSIQERSNIQCANRQNHDDRDLFPASHLQVPNQEDRKDREGPVTCASDGRVTVEDRDNDEWVHAGTLAASVLLPEVSTWQALEQENEEEHGAVKFRDDEYGPHNGLMDFVDTEA